jgi:DNA-binding transcriptional MerR regulator/effector-binding domain-containing protein
MKLFGNNMRDSAEEYTLSVGQFAKLCGTTRDTLRHYYESGIIVPKVDPENGYHYYSASQITSFFFITTMRQAGCSIKEISDLIGNSSKDGIKRLTNAKILDMQRELFLINKRISALHMGLWILETFDSHTHDTPFLQDIPSISIIRTPVRDKTGAHHTADIAKDISVHISKTTVDGGLSSFPSGVTISYEDLSNKNYVYNSVVSFSLMPADGNSGAITLPAGKALCCHHESRSQGIEKTYKKMLSYIKKNRLKACSDLYIISLINLYQKDEHTYYKYLFICVEQ